jgi:hypothetical protein
VPWSHGWLGHATLAARIKPSARMVHDRLRSRWDRKHQPTDVLAISHIAVKPRLSNARTMRVDHLLGAALPCIKRRASNAAGCQAQKLPSP